MNALRNEKITFRLVGRIDNKYSEILEALNLENLKRIGQYDSDVLDKHINGADLAIVWPQWPETYLMTVDELLAYNIPIISNSLGAQNERLNNHSHGILINNSRYDLIDKLRQFINNPEQLRQLKQSENNYKVHTTINEHLTYISDIYTQICPPFKSSRTLSKYYLSPSCNHDLRDLGLPFSNKYFTSDEIIIQSELILSSKISTTPLNNKLIKNEFLDLNKEELLEKIDSILEDTNSNFLSNIDLINERIFVPNTTYPCTDELVISGWATHKNSSSLSEEVIICFATKSAEFIFFSGERNLRPDVGVNFQNEKLSNSGFRFVISSNNLIFNEQLEIFVFIRTLHGYSNESNLIGSHLGSFTLNHDC